MQHNPFDNQYFCNIGLLQMVLHHNLALPHPLSTIKAKTCRVQKFPKLKKTQKYQAGWISHIYVSIINKSAVELTMQFIYFVYRD